MTEPEPGDIVICTVEKIVGTVVFVKISVGNREIDGSIVTSEIAPGRIRNIRDYVVPKKRIVCEVLRISSTGNVELSLRRVTQKERKEALEQDKQEKSYINILKSILKEKSEEIVAKIKESEKLYDFFQESKKNPSVLEKLVGEKDSERILEILKSQKQKKLSIKKEILLSSSQPDGIELIKKLLMNIEGAEIKYISAGKYSLKTESEDPKAATNKLKNILDFINKSAKEEKLDFEIIEK
jgi:translation initiation factor 2 subunit 1